MDKNKTILTCVAIICATFLTAFSLYTYFSFNRLAAAAYNVKDKELEIGLYDQYTYCMRSVMRESKKNGTPCTAHDAEKICVKFNTKPKDN